MGGVDRRGRLEEQPFAYREVGGGVVAISWRGREVTMLRGATAARFLGRVQEADQRTAQLLMAKVTGNFKHGNERAAKRAGD